MLFLRSFDFAEIFRRGEDRENRGLRLGADAAECNAHRAERRFGAALLARFVDLRAVPRAKWEEIRIAPAAALGSCRKKMKPEDCSQGVEICRRHNIRYFLYIGGNDSMDTANKMAKIVESTGYEMFVAGVPKTIDNDLPETDFCPGFGSCARYMAQSTIDLGEDIRSLPTPVSILEAMGRNAGWVAASTMLARRDAETGKPCNQK